MTTSKDDAYHEDLNASGARLRAERRLSSEIETGRRDIVIALAVIALAALPIIFFGTRDGYVTGCAAGLILVCGTYILVRFQQAGKRESQRLAEDRSE